MSKQDEKFFTSVGCMDGRVQEVVAGFGRKKFRAKYADTITEAGLVGLLGAKKIKKSLVNSLKKKMLISIEKHYSKGIIVHGHQECVGNPVDDGKHKDDIRKSVQIIKSMVNSSVPVLGAFVKRSSQHPSKWEIEEV
jgi:hypothetical protein